ncbi:MAG: glycosyltransferase [Dehalococcoidia bacterium]|nr:glycosyltransferase [Dehalococcoidia bacterium]
MKIALVSPYDMTYPSGVNAHIEHLAVEMRRRGHAVRTFAPGAPQREPDPYHVTLGRSVPIPSGGSLARVTFSPSILGAVRRLLEQEPFDVIHLHEPLVPALPPVFLRYSRSVNVGTFHAAHDGGSRLYFLTRPVLRRWAARLHGRARAARAD